MREAAAAEADVARPNPIARGRRSRFLLTLLIIFISVVCAELTARAYWRLRHRVPVRDPARILYAFYPELRRIDALRPTRDDEFFDILFLGGSALNSDWVPDLDSAWGQIGQQLREQLAYKGQRKVRIFNLAMPGHTSRDSWLKYATLAEARFDLVLVYHGINEARANNAPPQIFRPDYAHYSWYRVVNALASYHGRAAFALPYTLRYIAIGVQHALTKGRYVPTHSPREDWVRYGDVPRSAQSFRHNLSAVLDTAARRDDRVLLMTFATYVPDNYSRDAFLQKRLDYGLHLAPIELWGVREHVLATVAVHNEIVRKLATEHANVWFVDQARLMAGVPGYFNDPCHLTVLGSARFVENLLAIVLP